MSYIYREIQRFIEKIHYGNVPGWPVKGLLFFLDILSIGYGMAMAVREVLYSLKILKTHEIPSRVISVGNITIGGSGKTPVTMHIARIFTEEGKKVAVLSRGYGRRGGKRTEVVSDSSSIVQDWSRAGDEPYLIARSLSGTTVVVGKDRLFSGMKAIQVSGADTIILDDGFQYRRLKRDLDILVVDGVRGTGNGRLLPRGPLREKVRSIRRADLIIITKKRGGGDDGKLSLPCMPSVPVFQSRYRIKLLKGLGNGEKFPPSFLGGKRVVAFCGIADPESFFSMAEDMGAVVVKRVIFPDHHIYRRRDLDAMGPCDRSIDFYLTTEKDMIKLEGLWSPEMPIYAMQIEVDFFDEEAFRRCLIGLSLKEPHIEGKDRDRIHL